MIATCLAALSGQPSKPVGARLGRAGLTKRPNTSLTRNLVEDAKEKIPRLKFDLGPESLRNFVIDEERIGIKCRKYESSATNGWSFPTPAECREAWERTYGPTSWDNSAEEWSCAGTQPKKADLLKIVVPPPAAEAPPVVVPPAPPAGAPVYCLRRILK
jgi:hypothetical protein